MRSPSRRALLSLLPAAAFGAAAPPARARVAPLNVAAFPLVDRIVAAAQPAWSALHPDVALDVVGRPYADHHTAMAGSARLSANQSICTISIEIAQPAITSRSSRVNPASCAASADDTTARCTRS